MTAHGRLAVVAVLVTGLLLVGAVVAFAATPKTGSWSGTNAQNYPLSYKVVNGPKVKNLSFKVQARCPGGTVTLSGTMPWTEKVNGKGKFSFHGTSGNARVDVTGKFTSKSKANGTMKYSDYVPELGGSCSSGNVGWTTHAG